MRTPPQAADSQHVKRAAVLFLILAVALAILLCITLLTRRDAAAEAPPTPAPTAEPTATPEPTPEPTPPPTILGETEDMGQEYIDRMMFLGDSITYQMASNDFLPFTQVWVPAVGTLALFSCPVALINYYPMDDPDNPRELTIAETAAAAKPEYLVITLGINGVAVLNESEFKRYYSDLIDSIQEASPDTKIICQSIFPVVESLTPEGITNSNVNMGNQWILQIAEEKGLRYLNTHDALMDSSGGLVPEYSPWDGYHVTAAAYEVIFHYIRTHGYQ